MSITRLVKMTFLDPGIHTFQQLFEEKKQAIRHFPGCLHLELWQDQLDHHIFFTYSIWQSETHLDDYRQSDFFRDTWQATKQLFAAKPQAWTTSCVSKVEGGSTKDE